MVEHFINSLSTLLDETWLLQYLGDEFATWHTIDRKDIVHINTDRETSSIGDDELVRSISVCPQALSISLLKN